MYPKSDRHPWTKWSSWLLPAIQGFQNISWGPRSRGWSWCLLAEEHMHYSKLSFIWSLLGPCEAYYTQCFGEDARTCWHFRTGRPGLGIDRGLRVHYLTCGVRFVTHVPSKTWQEQVLRNLPHQLTDRYSHHRCLLFSTQLAGWKSYSKRKKKSSYLAINKCTKGWWNFLWSINKTKSRLR
jgi:hypothetical protein